LCGHGAWAAFFEEGVEVTPEAQVIEPAHALHVAAEVAHEVGRFPSVMRRSRTRGAEGAQRGLEGVESRVLRR